MSFDLAVRAETAVLPGEIDLAVTGYLGGGQ